MSGAPSSTPLFGIIGGIMREENPTHHHLHMMSTQQQSSTTAVASSTSNVSQTQKKRRNQSGTPNEDAEVIALSPKTLMATNRFICEVCKKGFQREQNLQLHRRGHNLPWKLKQKSTTKDPKRKVYLCPEPTCVHHHPSRALGDLTGIKKHFSRKHGEKKWKCEKCSKKYAVQSDWKAHSKTCGTREYRCDCGTLFSRRDSFITHRAFCDALAQESAISRQPAASNLLLPGTPHSHPHHHNVYAGSNHHQYHHHHNINMSSSSIPISNSSQLHHNIPSITLSSSPLMMLSSSTTNNSNSNKQQASSSMSLHGGGGGGLMHLPDVLNHHHHLLSRFFPNTTSSPDHHQYQYQFNNNMIGVGSGGDNITTTSEASSSGLGSCSIQPPHMSATALLQKAAQMGSTSTTTIHSNHHHHNHFQQFQSHHDDNNLTLDFLGVGGRMHTLTNAATDNDLLNLTSSSSSFQPQNHPFTS